MLLPEYIFIIRSAELECEPPRAVEISGGDKAALDYACDLVRQLKKGGGYDDPGLVVIWSEMSAVGRSFRFRFLRHAPEGLSRDFRLCDGHENPAMQRLTVASLFSRLKMG